MNKHILHIVTGAPGSGKSTTVEMCSELPCRFLALDMDALIESASVLAKKDIHYAPELWPQYNALWLQIMQMLVRAGTHPVLFSPLAPHDLKQIPLWCSDIRWLLLDCADDILQKRLARRKWSDVRIRTALDDARELRATVTQDVIDTGTMNKGEVVEAIRRWYERPDQR